MIALQVLLYSDNDYRTIYMSSINRKHTLLCDICLERRQSHSEKSILAHFLHVSTANSGLNIDSHFTMFPVKLCLSLFSLVRRQQADQVLVSTSYVRSRISFSQHVHIYARVKIRVYWLTQSENKLSRIFIKYF